ncbi:zinc-dependent alcohol dehydrogenase [Nocardia brevicatena]|uniref:zinc-dependent alcohol dehydrogenase n=1 Tax=Nocardia brevicatena TaxID=37327 RepID=UPI0002E1DCCD|nr:alcohol dehydrogenase catalytic domain-containing protein [Nocardia brevicatena]
MAETARAAVLVEPGHIRLDRIGLPAIGADDALIRVEACGICGTDWEQYNGEYRPVFPVILGHEPLGIIAEIGDGARRRWQVDVGDRVAVYPRFGCGHCAHCMREDFRHCPEVGIYGFSTTDRAPGLWGGYADYMYLSPGSKLRKMPRHIPAEVAVQFNPLGAGFAWAVNTPVTAVGDDVVVLGCGQRGLASVLAAREAGARRVIVTGLARDADKLTLAREFGADATINIEAEDPVAVVRDLTAGVGARVVVDTTPRAAESVTDAIDMAAQGGIVVLAGLKGVRTVPGLFSDRIITKELTIKGVLGVDYTSLEQAVRLIESGRYPLHRLHTHSFDIGEVTQALETLARGEAIHLAIMPGTAQ